MARSRRTLYQKQHNQVIQDHQNSKTYRTAQNRRRLLMLLGWSPSSRRNLLLTQYRQFMTFNLQNQKEIRTMTRPADCRTWVTVCCAGKEREGFEQRDLPRAERSDAAGLDGRCSVSNRGQQRDKVETSSHHCVHSLEDGCQELAMRENSLWRNTTRLLSHRDRAVDIKRDFEPG